MILNKNHPDFEFNDDYFFYLLENNIPFDREDICEFIDGWCYLVKRAEFCDNWTRHITTICELKDHYYAVEWDAGLTKYGEDYYDEQPYEVFPEEEKRVFTVNKWKNKNGDTICEFYKEEKNE